MPRKYLLHKTSHRVVPENPELLALAAKPDSEWVVIEEADALYAKKVAHKGLDSRHHGALHWVVWRKPRQRVPVHDLCHVKYELSVLHVLGEGLFPDRFVLLFPAVFVEDILARYYLVRNKSARSEQCNDQQQYRYLSACAHSRFLLKRGKASSVRRVPVSVVIRRRCWKTVGRCIRVCALRKTYRVSAFAVDLSRLCLTSAILTSH